MKSVSKPFGEDLHDASCVKVALRGPAAGPQGRRGVEHTLHASPDAINAGKGLGEALPPPTSAQRRASSLTGAERTGSYDRIWCMAVN